MASGQGKLKRYPPSPPAWFWVRCPRCLEPFPAGPPLPPHLRDAEGPETEHARFVRCERTATPAP